MGEGITWPVNGRDTGEVSMNQRGWIGSVLSDANQITMGVVIYEKIKYN